jgi:hypothetical protein
MRQVNPKVARQVNPKVATAAGIALLALAGCGSQGHARVATRKTGNADTARSSNPTPAAKISVTRVKLTTSNVLPAVDGRPGAEARMPAGFELLSERQANVSVKLAAAVKDGCITIITLQDGGMLPVRSLPAALKELQGADPAGVAGPLPVWERTAGAAYIGASRPSSADTVVAAVRAAGADSYDVFAASAEAIAGTAATAAAQRDLYTTAGSAAAKRCYEQTGERQQLKAVLMRLLRSARLDKAG